MPLLIVFPVSHDIHQPSQFRLSKKTALYAKTPEGGFVLYKQPGLTLREAGLEGEIPPGKLCIRPEDKEQALGEIQAGLNAILKKRMNDGDLDGVKETMVTLMEATMAEPRAGSLEGLSDSVQALSQEYADQPDVLRSLAFMSFKDYTTAMHSVNVMALTLAYCAFWAFDLREAKNLGMAALLHDVGKTKIPLEILTAPRKLSPEEFAVMRSHPAKGFDILKDCNFPSRTIAQVALQHHEKLNGRGYPRGIVNIPEHSRLVGLIDCYEAITADERPYRSAMDPYKALSVIGKEVADGSFDQVIYARFVMSLG